MHQLTKKEIEQKDWVAASMVTVQFEKLIGKNPKNLFPDYNMGSAFAYLYRRFGPPKYSYDSYKHLACYYLSTEKEDLFLRIIPNHSFCTSIGYCVPKKEKNKRIEQKININSEDSDKYNKWNKEIHKYIYDALKELKKPVMVRDVHINFEGVVDEKMEKYGVANCHETSGLGLYDLSKQIEEVK